MTRIENILPFAPRAEQFLADAVAATGLSDFGDEAFPFREGYELFLAELDREGRLSTEGAGATETQIGLMLRARLATVAAWKANPGYRDVEIRRPIIITGIVRSGTTALHHLMAIDSQFLGCRTGWCVLPVHCRRSRHGQRRPTTSPQRRRWNG